MKTKFALPTDRDMKFSRYSGLRADDFGREVKMMDSVADAIILVVCLVGVLALFGMLK